MDIKSVKGFRDFYPEQMALRNYLYDAWRRVSRRNGFVEYDGPILEYLDLYRIKSGDEIVSQLFSLTDRGGRELAMRPETTPTLARMINAKINALGRPIKWFSISNVFRAENPQKGRGREFSQWNVDVVGSDEALADAECIFTLIDLLAEVGLTADDAGVLLSSRSLIAAALTAIGVAEADQPTLLTLLDKRDKVAPEAFVEMCAGAGLSAGQIDSISRFQDSPTLADVAAQFGDDDNVGAECDKLAKVTELLWAMGAADYCKLDLHVVRGLAYYTGAVYEAFDAGRKLRALAGGGRYDNLLTMLGGPQVGAAGFGMGDMVLGILLAEAGKLPDLTDRPDCLVIDADADLFADAVGIAAQLRRAGVKADLSYKRQGLGKQLKTAAKKGAAAAVIVGAELAETGEVIVKNLATGDQRRVGRDQLADELKR